MNIVRQSGNSLIQDSLIESQSTLEEGEADHRGSLAQNLLGGAPKLRGSIYFPMMVFNDLSKQMRAKEPTSSTFI